MTEFSYNHYLTNYKLKFTHTLEVKVVVVIMLMKLLSLLIFIALMDEN